MLLNNLIIAFSYDVRVGDGAKTVIKQFDEFFGNFEEIKACNLIPL